MQYVKNTWEALLDSHDMVWLWAQEMYGCINSAFMWLIGSCRQAIRIWQCRCHSGCSRRRAYCELAQWSTIVLVNLLLRWLTRSWTMWCVNCYTGTIHLRWWLATAYCYSWMRNFFIALTLLVGCFGRTLFHCRWLQHDQQHPKVSIDRLTVNVIDSNVRLHYGCWPFVHLSLWYLQSVSGLTWSSGYVVLSVWIINCTYLFVIFG